MVRIKERRRRRRIYVALPISFTYNNKRISSQTKNISSLGAYLETDVPVSVGVVLNIKLKVPNISRTKLAKVQQIHCAGIVFRCQALKTPGSENRYGIGIFFRAFLEEGEQRLVKYVDYVLLQEKKAGKIYIRKRKQAKKGRKQ